MNTSDNPALDRFVDNVREPQRFDVDFKIIIDSTDELYNAREWTGYDFKYDSEYEEISRLKGRFLSPQEWRWEFTRRNELYRRLFLFSKSPNRTKTQFSPARLAEEIFGTIYHTDPNRGVLHMRKDAIEWQEGKSASFFCPDFEGFVLFKNNYRPNRIIYSNDWFETPRFDHPLVFYASFDPLRDAKEQIEFIQSYLAEQQRKFKVRKTRRQFELWPTYLRILDAVDAGLGPTKVAELIGSDPQAIKASIKQAQKWVHECTLIL